MATEYESQLVSQYGTGMNDFINAERAKGKSGLLKGSNVDSQDVSGLTSAFLSANKNLAPEVYSAQNLTQTTTAPVATPDLSDPFGLYDYYFNSADMVSAREQSSSAYADLLAAKARAREAQTALGDELAPMAAIRGAQARSSELSTNEIAALSDAYNVAVSNYDTISNQATAKYGIAQQERTQIQNLISETGGKAGISYTDSYETAVEKAADYKKKQDEGDYKKTLQQEARSLGLSTKTKKGGTLDINGLEKAIADYYKKEGLSKKELDKRLNDLTIKGKELDIKAAEKSLSGSGSGSSSGDSELVKSFDKDIERLQTAMDKEDTSIDWAYSWNYINNKYPGFAPEEIDAALGLNFRRKFEGK